MPPLNMDLHVGAAQVVIRLRGDVDAGAALDMVAVADAATARPGLRCVVLDLSRARFLGSAGHEAVLRIRELGMERGLEVEVHTSEPGGIATGLTSSGHLRLAQ